MVKKEDKMQDISVSFRIAVNANKDRIIEILKLNKDIGIIALEDNELVIGQNNVIIKYNEDYNKILSSVDQDSYLYYESNIDFYPKDNAVLLENQIQLSKDIIKIFADYAISSEIIAEFENLL